MSNPVESLARYVLGQFRKGLGAEFTIDLTGLPVANARLCHIWVLPSSAWGADSPEIMVCSDAGGVLLLEGANKPDVFNLITAGFSKPLAEYLVQVFDAFSAVAEEKPASHALPQAAPEGVLEIAQ